MSSLTLAEPVTNQVKYMAPQLQGLPDELLVEVFRYLPKADLKSARLTCTRYAHVGAQWLFQRVYFAPSKAAIDTFLNISANPTFARTVTELVYDGRLFLPELTAYKPFKEAFDAIIRDEDGEDDGNIAGADQAGDRTQSTNNIGRDTTTPSRSMKPLWKTEGDERYHEFLANSLVRYTRLVDQQQSILEDQKDYEALCTGLKNLPNISTVIVLDEFLQCCDWTPLRFDNHSWYHQRSWRETAVLAPSQWPRDINAGDEFTRKKWDIRGIQNLIRAVSVHCQKLKEIHLASESSKAPMTIFEMDEDVYNEACAMAQRLTSLIMNLYVSRSDSDDEWQEQYDCLDGFLSEAKDLRCLAMRGRIDIYFFKYKNWPHLETLMWGDLDLDAAGLEAITQTHKGTLRELTLRNVYMNGTEGWADAAKKMGKYLKLHRISVLGVCDEVTTEGPGAPYLEDETNLAVARSFMQSIPRTTLLDEDSYTIIACPEEDTSLAEVGDSHSS
ncbi:MAG: hypothetical protein ASARMPREDX12_001915 [Alectoria sarmentosa]|nr:MAG: hypothetical protein ASARMPREDX12_001915 [Alectoria sarmentosa]